MTPSDILDYIRSCPQPQTKRDIARAFGIKGSGPRTALKFIIKDLEKNGAIEKVGGGYTIPDGLPGVCMATVSDITVDGDVIAVPTDWDHEKPGTPPAIEVMPSNKGHPALIKGDQALLRLKRISDGHYEGRIIKHIDQSHNQITGFVKFTKKSAILIPSDKKAKQDYLIAEKDLNGAKDGDLVVGEVQKSRARMRQDNAKIIKVLGAPDDPGAISLISLTEKGLREDFPPKVLTSCKDLKVPPLKKREDLREIPLVTIDSADARDFDDAVFAEKTDNGYHLIVAIADVAHYVRPDSPLDKEALRRGNSTYFPDRVVPMLPEALSNDLCSLRPHEDRACLAVHMHIDDKGKLQSHKFVRGLMRSHARLTYEQVQAMKDGLLKEEPKLIKHICALYEAYEILDKARQKRGALDLDMAEHKIILDKNGVMTGVKPRERLDSHKLIEEFMVLANVAAAKALQARKSPCIYRIHDRPNTDKIESLRDFLDAFDITLPKGQVMQSKQINGILCQANQTTQKHLIHTMILRTQSQAVYAPENIGHFGLALKHYAHFTSPIRRYADLIVHRLLIAAYGLGDGPISDTELTRLEEICQHISATERTSMEAERSAVDRFKAAFLSQKINAEFAGRISGVTSFGLFVELNDIGADGLVPITSLPDDYYIHNEDIHSLVGRHTGRIFQMGAQVTARIMEADGLTGSTIFNLTNAENGATIPGAEPIVEPPRRRPRKASFRKHDKPDKKKKKTTPKHLRKKKPYKDKK